MDVIELIDHCRQFVGELTPDCVEPPPESYLQPFDEKSNSQKDNEVNIFTFHSSVPDSHSKVITPDVQLDHSDFDYEKICEEMVRSALALQPGARVIFATDCESLSELSHPQVTVIRLPINPLYPMYERVRVMRAYAYSNMFNKPTLFLDSDAFINMDLKWVFHNDMDIGVTYRHGSLMPINEGVFFSNSVRPDAVKLFFDHYLSVYHRIIDDKRIEEIYGDVRRWRGGQLSLNTVACPLGRPSALDSARFFGVSINYFPCHELNFSFERDREYTEAEVASKGIIHLKGALKKHLLEKLVELQNSHCKQRSKINLKEM